MNYTSRGGLSHLVIFPTSHKFHVSCKAAILRYVFGVEEHNTSANLPVFILSRHPLITAILYEWQTFLKNFNS